MQICTRTRTQMSLVNMAAFSSASRDDFTEDILRNSTVFAAQKLKITGFKDLQLKAILSVLRGQDTFVSLPTGYGKSAIFEAIPLCRDYLRTLSHTFSLAQQSGQAVVDLGTTVTSSPSPAVPESNVGPSPCTVERHSIVVIISPLVSLMKNQVETLRKLGLTAVHLGDSSPEDDQMLKEGKISYVLMSPESVFERGFQLFQSSSWHENLSAIAVDESHCVIKWGKHSTKLGAFRSDYGRLAEIRSLIPRAVPVIALTATSSLALRSELISNLSLTSPSIITDTPDRPNIHYSIVNTSQTEQPEIFHSLVLELKEKKQQAARTVIFCRTHRQCRSLSSYFFGELGTECKQYFAMFHSTSEESVKDHVLKSFSDPDGVVRILFCTKAFGMGINCRNLTRVFHFGPSEDIDDYVQECGRGGRGGEICTAVLIKYRGCTRLPTSQRIKEYLKNETRCRRELLLAPFGKKPDARSLMHTCCDVCAKKCTCGGVTCSDSQYGDFVIMSPEAEEEDTSVCRRLTEEEKATLRDQLTALREESLQNQRSTLYGGHDLTGALPQHVIDLIVRDCEIIKSQHILDAKYPFFGNSSRVWELISTSGTATTDSSGLSAECSAELSDSSECSDSDIDTPEHRGVLIFSSDSD